MIIELQRNNRIPLYLQIAAQVREMISRGTIKLGDRLPANRELARLLDVNRTTVTTAYAELEADGLINSQVGRGTFVSAIPASTKVASKQQQPVGPSPMSWSGVLLPVQRDRWLNALLQAEHGREVISFAHGLPEASLFPLDEFRRSVDRVLRREGRVLLQLGSSSGYRPLQEYLCSQMALDGVNINPDELLITNGCQQSLDLIRRLLVAETDEIAIEEPTYPGAISVFCSTGSKYIGIPVGKEHMDLDVLEDVLLQRRPKLIYTIPTFHNPTGVTLGLPGRRRLIELAARYRVPIVEDDIYRELHYEGQMLPSLKALDQSGVVISINSFSKVGFPGLRVGWIAAPRAVIEHLNIVKQNCDLHASLLTQAAIYEFSRRGLLAKHIRRVRKEYARRRDVMLAAMETHFPSEITWNKPKGGMAIWATLPASLSSSEILIHAAERGVVFSPGEHFYPGSARRNLLRLCFTMSSAPAIGEGIKRLGAVIKERIMIQKKSKVRKTAGLRALV
ncbi:MAG TPA: PLP-dependent aminotransferase family protein [Blastocatellia bacterium]|nr:PLP-dependent aminotransferase family protein [Blastocatellia bacterium]